MKLNLHLVRIFYQIVESQSFTKAAEKLFISQSAVSKAIRELETQLGLSLIERNMAGVKKNRTIKLTEDGRILFEHARAIFSLEKVAIDDLQARIGLKQGKLRVGASTTVASYWLANYVTAFHQKYPNIELNIKVGNTEMMRQALINCDIDLAIVEGEVDDQRIHREVWQQEELSIITSPDMNLSLKELSNQLWLVREQGSGTYKVTENMLQTLNVKPKQRLIMASNEGIARMVACGAGVAILPACIVEDLITLKKVKVLQLPQAKKLIRALYLITLQERPISTLLQRFIEELKR
ncbi:LysR family transcriptional regulator [Entomomonas sp. E2T0]|uniref:LysR family transcriptional regulator n=1 Tax=Entomomonas sp. E2T0 TaxID=2930213 RepID=UPI00222821E4|nr:LysR family transcriptional regulator [Entomomonas sp. E2T0]UYZ84431.1 LysR family transcriptional regulator [Entomomonas sp. E2T0]